MSRPARGPEPAGRRLATSVLSVLLAACSGPPPPAPDTVARLADRDISLPLFERYVEVAVGEPARDLDSAVLSRLLDQFLEEELLARLAVERGVSGPDDPHRRSVDRLLRAEQPPAPTDGEVRAYYDRHRQRFARPERVLLRQVLVEDREAAERAMAELARGVAFEEVARRHSREPSAELGGLQGELARDDLPPAFVEPIFALSPGQVSEIIAADYGFHIFQVVKRAPAEVAPLEQVEEEIRRLLLEKRSDQLLEQLVEEARSLYNLEVYDRNLPFNYRGSYREEKD